MKKQNLKEDSDLPLNHYITVNFKCYFNLISTTHGTRPQRCAQMKAQILEPANITFLPKICLNKSLHTGTNLLILPVANEVNICTNSTIHVEITASLPSS